MAETRKRSFFDRLFGVEAEEPRDELPASESDKGEQTAGPELPPTFTDHIVAEQAAPEPLLPEPVPSVENLEQLRTEAVVTPPPYVEASPVAAPASRQSWFDRLRGGLSRSSNALGSGITQVFAHRKLDRTTLYDFEDLLIQADLGVATAEAIRESIERGRYASGLGPDEVRGILAAEVEKELNPAAKPLVIDSTQKPFVILMVGVNGSGKTTTIGKLASRFRSEGRHVMLAAGDTFRAAAIEQLQVWGERSGAPVVSRPQGTEAASLAFDAMVEARKSGTDVLIIDTAGRLQNRAELMAELTKVIRVIRKQDETAPHAVLLTLDATTGQNAVNEVEVFGREAGVTGLVMTKLDGTARGGILVPLAQKSGLPIHFIGVGEGIDDLQPFTARDFARAIAGLPQ